MRTMLRSVRFWIVVLACAMPVCCLAEDAGQDSIAQALVLFRAGKVKQAETVLRSVTAAEPNSPAAHGGSGGVVVQGTSIRRFGARVGDGHAVRSGFCRI